MSLSPAVIDAMVAAGVTVEQLAAAIKADMQEAEVRARSKREADAERQRKSRANRAVSRNVTVTPCDTRDTSPEVSPKDIYSNPLPNPSDAEASSPPLAEKVVVAWNEGPGAAGAVTAKPLNADRRKALSVRVRENGEAAVFDAIRNLGRSAWHCGGNDRGWRADIGWLLKSPEHFQKALEMEPARTAAPAINNLASLAAQAARYRRPTMTNPSPRGETREARA